MSILKENMTMDLQLKWFSEQTQKAYISMERKLSKSYINTTYSALNFFYTVTLGREWEMK